MIAKCTCDAFCDSPCPVHAVCNKASCSLHVPVFDEAEATKLLENWQPTTDVEFINGNPAAAEVRKRWPRFNGTCSCGFNGIFYASWAHYTMGDW